MSAVPLRAVEAAPVERIAPHSVEAEQSVLGGLLLDNSAWGRAGDLLTDSDFYSHEHRCIFGSIGALVNAGQPADVITVFEQLQSLGQAEDCGGLVYLNALVQSVPSAANMRRYAEIVHEHADRRRLIAGAQAMIDRAFDARGATAPEIASGLGTFDTPSPTGHRLLTAVDLEALPPAQWRIHGVLPATGCGAIYGPSGSGKSFLVLDMIASIGRLESWFGYRVKFARVVYVALEGQHAVPKRVKALEAAKGLDFPDSVRFVFDDFVLTEPADVRALARAIEAAGGADVIVIDTLNRAAPGCDENSSQDMGYVLAGVKELQSLTGGLVLLVHHAGKDATRGMRGHSSLYAALDVVIEVTRTGDTRGWTLAKAKDGADGQAHSFRLGSVVLGLDDDGEPITSCAVEVDVPDPVQVQRPKLPTGGNQKIVLDALGPLFRASHHFGHAGAPAMRPCIELDAAIEGTRDRLAVEPKRRNERARQAITSLIAARILGSNEGWLWLI